MQRYCEDVEPGEGHLADCLAQYQAAADAQEDNGEAGGWIVQPLTPLSRLVRGSGGGGWYY